MAFYRWPLVLGVLAAVSSAHAQVDGWRVDRGPTDLSASNTLSTTPQWARRWKVRVDGAVRSSPVIGYDRIIVGTDAGHVMALRPADGARIWTYNVGSPVSTSVAIQHLINVAYPIVWFSAENGTLYALNGDTGTLLWSLAGGGQTWNSPPNYQVPRKVFYTYATGLSSRLRAVDAVTGQILWEAQQSGNISPQTPMVLHSQNLLIQGYAQMGTQIRAFRTTDGAALWTLGSSTTGSSAYTSGAYASGYNRLIVSLKNAAVAAYSINTQHRIWETTLPGTGAVIGLAALQPGSSGTVVAAQQNALHALDAQTGTISWSIKHSGNLIDPTTRRTPMPAIHGNVVLHVENGSQLVARRLSNGEELWAAALQGPIVSSPAIAQQVVAIGTSAGFVYLFARCR